MDILKRQLAKAVSALTAQLKPKSSIRRYGLMVSLVLTLVVIGSAGVAHAGTGGRFTFMRDDGSLWGENFYGAGLGEIPFAIDTNGDRRQELAVYYKGRMTIRRDDGSYWGLDFRGGGYGEAPLAIDRRSDSSSQQLAVYYQGRFTWRNDNGSYDGVTFPGATRLDLPLAVDTDGDGRQEFAVYRSGRFTFMRDNGSLWGITFAGATATDIPFVIDTNGDGRQELAVYRDNRVTIRHDDGSYSGFNYPGSGTDDLPLAVDTNGDRRQEFTMYNHVSTQLSAKQILGQRFAGQVTIHNYSENPSRDSADRSFATMQLEDIADGGNARLSTRCSYASQLPSTVAPDPTFLRFLVDYGQRSNYDMNVLFGQCHLGPGSAHHKGKAADFSCAANITDGDAAARRYGVARNFETCAKNQHWHYSVGGI